MQLPNPHDLQLTGTYVRLDPFNPGHLAGLVSAAGEERGLYQWSPVPQTLVEMQRYIGTAVSWRDAGTAIPFAIVRLHDGTIIGSTRFWNIERWLWPEGHARSGRGFPDACEIGYTWLSPAAVRTAANTESKLLMLTHAFVAWQVLRVCFHTDARNTRSRAALERIGAKYEGILRSHRLAADSTARDSVRYSIVAAEWPDVQRRLRGLLDIAG